MSGFGSLFSRSAVWEVPPGSVQVSAGTPANVLNTTPVSPGVPTNSVGSLLLLQVFSEVGPSTPVAQTGWTVVFFQIAGAATHTVYGRISTGTEGSTVAVDVTGASGRTVARIYQARGLWDPSVLANLAGASASSGSGTGIGGPSIPDSAQGSTSLSFVGYDSGGTISAYSASDWAKVATEAVAGSAAGGCGILLQSAPRGSRSGGTSTLSDTAVWGAFSFSLAPVGFVPDAVAASVGPTTSPSWIAVGTFGDTGGSPTYGTNLAGDAFLMMVAGRVTAFTPPAGWTLIASTADTAGRRVFFAIRDTRSSGSESGSVSITATGASYGATIHTFRNLATSSFSESAASGGRTDNGNGPLPPPGLVAGGSVTSAGPYRLAICGCGAGGDASGVYPASIVATGGTWTLVYQGATGTATNSDWALYVYDFGASAGTITGGDGGILITEHATSGLALVGV